MIELAERSRTLCRANSPNFTGGGLQRENCHNGNFSIVKTAPGLRTPQFPSLTKVKEAIYILL